MSRAEYDAIAQRQDAYVREQEMIVIDGDISNAPEVRTPARLIIERANANVAGMQQYLYFPKASAGEPEVTVIDTPNLDGARLPERPLHRRRPRPRRHARAQLRLLRRVEEGRAADVEQDRLRHGRPGDARRLQGRCRQPPARRRRSSSSGCRAPARRRRRSRRRAAPSRCRTTSSPGCRTAACTAARTAASRRRSS